METVPCDSCGNTSSRTILSTRDNLHGVSRELFSIVRCQRCGLRFTNPRPTRTEIGAFYPSTQYYAYQETTDSYKGSVGARKKALDSVLQALYGYPAPFPDKVPGIYHVLAHVMRGRYPGFPTYRPEAKVLDIGCGAGDFMLNMQGHGMNVEGIEFNREAVGVARRRGLNVVEGTIEEINIPHESYDCVRMAHVLEHVESPSSVLRKIRGILRPGGELVILVPHAGSWICRLFGPHWFHYDVPRHLYHFEPSTITRILETAGYQHISVRRYAAEQSFQGSLNYAVRSALGNQGPEFNFFWSPVFRYLLMPFTMVLNFFGGGDLLEVRTRKTGMA